MRQDIILKKHFSDTTIQCKIKNSFLYDTIMFMCWLRTTASKVSYVMIRSDTGSFGVVMTHYGS